MHLKTFLHCGWKYTLKSWLPFNTTALKTKFQPDEQQSPKFIASCFTTSIHCSLPASSLLLLANIYFHNLPSFVCLTLLLSTSSLPPTSNFSSLLPATFFQSSSFFPDFFNMCSCFAAHTHAHTRTHMHARTHTHTHSETLRNPTLTTV